MMHSAWAVASESKGRLGEGLGYSRLCCAAHLQVEELQALPLLGPPAIPNTSTSMDSLPGFAKGTLNGTVMIHRLIH